MIVGVVNHYNEATIRFFVKGVSGILSEIEAVIDTGFTEYLSLPEELINALGLPFLRWEDMMQSDGSIVTFSVYEGIALWDGAERNIEIQTSAGSPLVGLALLQDNIFEFPVRPGSRVTISAIL